MLASESGAVDLAECPTRGVGVCRCGQCRVCGFAKHTAIHGPLLGAPPGSKPVGHVFVLGKFSRKRVYAVAEAAVPVVRSAHVVAEDATTLTVRVDRAAWWRLFDAVEDWQPGEREE